ncbi:HalOD1 output domain-containing protein [Halomicrobium salinisoli]|uniref:HalOD1 output domain-containing protein n=1 Tax=Halomicrobium salinisoli TaxID=2878391 RepID=UPI001CF079FA|nr:HalOD1 output domain-containing protein [Halomicrobium salinisoli]
MEQVHDRPWEETPLVRTAVGDEESIATVVARSVASVRGVPVDGFPPLYEAVDLEALERLFDDRGEGVVAFKYREFWVVVTASGTVSVHEDADVED